MAKPRATAEQHLRVRIAEFGGAGPAVNPDSVEDRHYGYLTVSIDVGDRGSRRVVPPAGEAHAFDVHQWARHVELMVSPTGRNVRVFVDGKEVPAP